MPVLAKTPAALPRFVPHPNGPSAGAGDLSRSGPEPVTSPSTEHLDRLAHDARNLLSGLMVYCGLLAAPGVLTEPYAHFAPELETVANNVAQILERILRHAVLRAAEQVSGPVSEPISGSALPAASPVPAHTIHVTDAAAELRRLQPLLAAIAGPAIRLSIATMPCAGPTALAIEDLTRILVNLVRNAADAMPAGGHIRIAVQYGDGFSFLDPADPDRFGTPREILLTVSDDGPGVPPELRKQVFDLGFTTREQSGNWAAPQRHGLGLSIVRNLVEAAGGSVRVVASHARGARFEISLPLREAVTSGTYLLSHTGTFPADFGEKGCLKCQ
jgi:signal transduction histidine kinase